MTKYCKQCEINNMKNYSLVFKERRPDEKCLFINYIRIAVNQSYRSEILERENIILS